MISPTAYTVLHRNMERRFKELAKNTPALIAHLHTPQEVQGILWQELETVLDEFDILATALGGLVAGKDLT